MSDEKSAEQPDSSEFSGGEKEQTDNKASAPEKLLTWCSHFWGWIGFGDKKLWDIFQLLFLPLLLAFGASYLQEDHNRQESLNKYLDTMQSLLLESKLRTSKEGSEVRIIARARTLTTLRGLDDNFLVKVDSSRKGQLLRFLQEAKLVTREKDGVIVPLFFADLSGADLSDTDLHDVDLRKANLRNANLKGALLGDDFRDIYLKVAQVTEAKLGAADLTNANLSNADLHGAFLHNVTLTDANLSNVDLRSADLGNEHSERGIDGAKLCKTTLPNGRISNRDCGK
jgi:uncharacterized protein YjbI with pentapeptide repeats